MSYLISNQCAHLIAGFLLFLSIFVLGDALKAIDNHLSSEDNARLQQVFADGIKSNDLQAIYFSALNLKDLSAHEKTNACQRLITLHTESKLNVSFSFLNFHHFRKKCFEMEIKIKTFFYRNLKRTFT